MSYQYVAEACDEPNEAAPLVSLSCNMSKPTESIQERLLPGNDKTIGRVKPDCMAKGQARSGGDEAGSDTNPHNRLCCCQAHKDLAESAYYSDPNRPGSFTEETRASVAYSVCESMGTLATVDEQFDSLQPEPPFPPTYESSLEAQLDCHTHDWSGEIDDDSSAHHLQERESQPTLTRDDFICQLVAAKEQEMVDNIMEKFRDMFGWESRSDVDSWTTYGSECSDPVPSDTGERESESSPHGTTQEIHVQRQSPVTSSKRGWIPNNPDEDDGNDEGHSKRPRGIPANAARGRLKQRFACPYTKRHPNHAKLKPSCVHNGFESSHRVKEHLFRVHVLHSQCSACYQMFDNSHDLTQHHIRSQCPRTGTQQELGFAMGDPKYEALKRKQFKATEIEKWNAIWTIIFPDEQPIPNPYFEPLRSRSPISESLASYEEECRAHLPGLVERDVRLRYGNLIREAVLRDLPEIIRANREAIASNYPEVQEFFGMGAQESAAQLTPSHFSQSLIPESSIPLASGASHRRGFSSSNTAPSHDSSTFLSDYLPNQSSGLSSVQLQAYTTADTENSSLPSFQFEFDPASYNTVRHVDSTPEYDVTGIRNQPNELLSPSSNTAMFRQPSHLPMREAQQAHTPSWNNSSGSGRLSDTANYPTFPLSADLFHDDLIDPSLQQQQGNSNMLSPRGGGDMIAEELLRDSPSMSQFFTPSPATTHAGHQQAENDHCTYGLGNPNSASRNNR